MLVAVVVLPWGLVAVARTAYDRPGTSVQRVRQLVRSGGVIVTRGAPAAPRTAAVPAVLGVPPRPATPCQALSPTMVADTVSSSAVPTRARGLPARRTLPNPPVPGPIRS